MSVSKKMILLVLSGIIGALLLAGIAIFQTKQVFTAANYGNQNSIPIGRRKCEISRYDIDG